MSNRGKSDCNNLEIENKSAAAHDKHSEEVNNDQEAKEGSLKYLIPTPTPTNYSSSEITKEVTEDVEVDDKIVAASPKISVAATVQSFPNIKLLTQDDFAQAAKAKQSKFRGFGAHKLTSHRMSIS